MPHKKKKDISKYRAPALEKGLDIIELLSRSKTSLTIAEMSEILGRSISELFRMLHVLEQRKYIEKISGKDGYTLTNRLFTLAIEQPPTKTMVEAAFPILRRLSNMVGQSCHLAIPSSDKIVVVARVEAEGELGFSVRTGYSRSIAESTSGMVLFAFQPEETRKAWVEELSKHTSKETLARLKDVSVDIRKQGYGRFESDFVQGVTDLSAPILRGNRAAAAITVPFVKYRPARLGIAEVLPFLREAAADISNMLTFGDDH